MSLKCGPPFQHNAKVLRKQTPAKDLLKSETSFTPGFRGDAVPTFLAVFGIVRDQYFYLGEEVVGAVPSTALASRSICRLLLLALL